MALTCIIQHHFRVYDQQFYFFHTIIAQIWPLVIANKNNDYQTSLDIFYFILQNYSMIL